MSHTNEQGLHLSCNGCAPVATDSDAQAEVLYNEPLREHTTFHIGGPARRFVCAKTREQCIAEARRCLAEEERWAILAGGSNSLFTDEEFAGTVLHIATNGICVREENEHSVRLQVEAGHNWDELVRWTIEHNLAGIEMLSGIPGTCGAAPVQNVGAYGSEIAHVLRSVTFYDFTNDTVCELPAEKLNLSYRNSKLKENENALVLAIDIELRKSTQSAPIVFPQLAEALRVPFGATLPLQQVREEVLALRAKKGMLYSAENPASWGAGSFFTNPIVPYALTQNLPQGAPVFPVDPKPPVERVTLLSDLQAGAELAITPLRHEHSPVKLSAAWLIEQAGISRGFSLPESEASISEKHTLAIINRTGRATFAEVNELMSYIQTRVHSEFGILLVPEPKIYRN